ncbi:unnamed protein product [Orchesella dallaii]|uniref:Uncharacterized protein n=1 Tax=Orchesella dallaii TaxID=48710 RepID=A0ABP1RJ78_9HEXA
MAVDPNNQIWLTSALTDNDVPKALTLCFSLKRGLTNRKQGVIASQKISPVLKEALHRGFDLFFYLDEDRNTAGLKCEDFAKLFALTLKSFRKCFYLEPTIVVIRNCDEVFEIVMHEQENFVFTQKENNMSVLLLRPSLLTFEVLMSSIADANGTDEQSGLSVMFPSEKTDCPSAGDFYSEYAEIFKMETLVGDAFSKWLEYAKNNLNSEKSIIRVLEVGAGKKRETL